MDAIRTEALTKHYHVGFWRRRPYVALDSLTLQVRQGEVFGFLGPNGAGKTTTLKLLMQLIFPTSGHAEILGKPVGDVGVKRRIGYLPENPSVTSRASSDMPLGIAAGASRRCWTKSASVRSGGCNCASSRRACSSGSASPRRW
jgi:ABC-2 type transport system ATP-binding protein